MPKLPSLQNILGAIDVHGYIKFPITPTNIPRKLVAHMAVDDYGIRIIETNGAAPNFSIDHDVDLITYIHDGDLSNLVLMAQRAGEVVAKHRLIPVIPGVE